MEKIIIYNPLGNTEGHSKQYASNIINGLTDLAEKIILVTSKDFDPSDLKRMDKVEIAHTPIKNTRSLIKKDQSSIGKIRYGLNLILNNLKSFSTFRNEMLKDKNNIGMIIGGDTLSNLFLILLHSKIVRQKLSITIHNADYDLAIYKSDKIRLLFKCISKYLLKVLLSKNIIIFTHGKIMSENLGKQLNVDRLRFSDYPVPAVAKPSISIEKRGIKSTLSLLFIGVIRKDKGLDDLASSLSNLVSKYDFELTIAGSTGQVGDDYVNNLLNMYSVQNVTKTNLGYLSDTKMEDLIIAADVVILPYKRSFIAKSVVLSDAARLGTPVIATAHSQNGYDVEQFNIGWIFTSEDRASLTKTLSSAFNELKQGKREYGFSEYQRFHEPQTVGKQICDAFDV